MYLWNTIFLYNPVVVRFHVNFFRVYYNILCKSTTLAFNADACMVYGLTDLCSKDQRVALVDSLL